MSAFLLAAEADKIQELLFRSSKLREVGGGSQMLENFCGDGLSYLISKSDNGPIKTLIASAGSFRLLFDDAGKAALFAEEMQEFYRRSFNNHLTVSEIIEVDNEQVAINESQKWLRKAKHRGRAPASIAQNPFSVICSSCGKEIAENYRQWYPEERGNYFCKTCEAKRMFWSDKSAYLSGFEKQINKSYLPENTEFTFPVEVDDIGRLNDLQFAAYIVADINDMGKIFGESQDFQELSELSEILEESWRFLTADLIESLLKWPEVSQKLPGIYPAFPLIAGGDDFFLLVPAKWGISLAKRLVHQFDQYFESVLADRKIKLRTIPTLSATVFICKANYPYFFAHEHGVKYLMYAKRKAKNPNSRSHAIQIISLDMERNFDNAKLFVPTFGPYHPELLEKILDYRIRLNTIPQRRRKKLLDLFDAAADMQVLKPDSMNDWYNSFERILKRMDVAESGAIRNILEDFKSTSSPVKYGWQRNIDIHRYYHFMPDLMRWWEFLYDVDKSETNYLGGDSQ